MSSRIGVSKWRVHDPSGVTYILPRERGRRRQALPLAPIQLQTKVGLTFHGGSAEKGSAD